MAKPNPNPNPKPKPNPPNQQKPPAQSPLTVNYNTYNFGGGAQQQGGQPPQQSYQQPQQPPQPQGGGGQQPPQQRGGSGVGWGIFAAVVIIALLALIGFLIYNATSAPAPTYTPPQTTYTPPPPPPAPEPPPPPTSQPQCGCNPCPCPEPEPVCTNCRTDVWLEQPPEYICIGSTVTLRGLVSRVCNASTGYVDPWVHIKFDRFDDQWIKTDAHGNFCYTFSAPQAHPHEYWITAKARVENCQEGEASVGFNLSSCNQPCGCTVCPCPQPYIPPYIPPCPCYPNCPCQPTTYPPTIPDCPNGNCNHTDPPVIPTGPGGVYVPPTTNPSPSQGSGGRLDPNSIQ